MCSEMTPGWILVASDNASPRSWSKQHSEIPVQREVGYCPCHSCSAIKTCFGIWASVHAQLCLLLLKNFSALREIQDDGNKKRLVLVMLCCLEIALKRAGRNNTKKRRWKTAVILILWWKESPLIKILPTPSKLKFKTTSFQTTSGCPS